MSLHTAVGIVLAFLIGAACGCHEGRVGREAAGGRGGCDTPLGGSGGGGNKGEGGSGEMGGGGGGGGGKDGGSGGAGGQGGLAWLHDEAIWRDLPHASSDAARIRVREALPGALRFPAIEWTDCGPGCERAIGTGTWFESAMSTAVTSEGPRAVLSSSNILSEYSSLRMLTDLRSGQTKIALRLDSLAFEFPSAPNFANSALVTKLYSTDMSLPALYDYRTGGWDFKLPWVTTVGVGLERWGVDSIPPALFYAGVSMMAQAGSNERTTIPANGAFGWGEGGAGLSVWSEISFGPSPSSRIRAWSPDDGVRAVVESMPGVACGLSVNEDSVFGLRSGDPDQAYGCEWRLRRPEFWRVSRSGGVVTAWPLPVGEEHGAVRSTTWGNFGAAFVYFPARDGLSAAARSSVFMVRFSDGEMRRFVPTPGYEWRNALIAMDDEHLYIGETREGEYGPLAQINRFRLDRFEEIGIPAK